LPLTIELLRAIVLVVGAILAVLVGLPVLLESAAMPLR
jgi:hypothetical protein